MQQWVRDVALPDGPALFVIEDETGSGKTEAALMLAHRLMRSGRAEGLYVALPTMATSNAMFDRLAPTHRNLFSAADAPSISLAHSARWFHEGFREPRSMREGRRTDSKTGDLDSEATASRRVRRDRDDRRKAFHSGHRIRFTIPSDYLPCCQTGFRRFAATADAAVLF